MQFPQFCPIIVKVTVAKASIPQGTGSEKPVGSCSDKVISLKELEKLDGHYLKVAEILLGSSPQRQAVWLPQ